MAAGFGYYGKIPSRGDFLRNNLPHTFIEPWDAWLQSAMVAGRTLYGESWQQVYFSAPIWRFTLPAGTCGQNTMLGILMPSVDQVGRQFPLTLAVVLGDQDAWSAFSVSDRTFEALEEAALAMLEDGTSPRDLDQALTQIDIGDVMPRSIPRSCGKAVAVAGNGRPGRAFAGAYLDARHPSTTLWASVIDGTWRCLACPSLPSDADEIQAIFDLAASPWSIAGSEAHP